MVPGADVEKTAEAAEMKEAEILRETVTFLRTIGMSVWVTEQGYRKERGGTRCTPGIPDLIVMGCGHFTFAELKTPKGKMRESQIEFADIAGENEVPCQLWRDVRDAFDWLVSVGIVEEGDAQ